MAGGLGEAMPGTSTPILRKKDVRLWVDDNRDPAANIAREEELFRLAEEGRIAQLVRLWVSSECLVRGRARNPRHGWYREGLAEEMGVSVIERSSGGGVVFHDAGNLNWSFYAAGSGAISAPRAIFEEGSTYVVGALGRLGIRAEFASPNRIDVAGRKVSGMAARVSAKGTLVHGTLLVSTDLAKLNRLCIPPPGCPPVSNLVDWVPGVKVQSVVRAFEEFLSASGLDVSRIESMEGVRS